MHVISESDPAFRSAFESGLLPPVEFTHRAHLRLAYKHLATDGPQRAGDTFKSSLLAYLERNCIDPSKFLETLAAAWLQAVWHFMQRARATSGSEARRRHVQPDLDPMPDSVDPRDPRAA